MATPRRGRSANVAERFSLIASAATALGLVLLLGGCARPVGDFGRAEPSVINDDVMPAVGSTRAVLAGEPVSSFNKTDEETEMANRIWRFVTSGHTKDWFADVAAELHRTRLTAGTGILAGHDRYYNWLHGTSYQSATVRYATLSSDVDADLATVPGTFDSICAVLQIDHERAVAAANLPRLGPGPNGDADARRAENEDQIDWFVRSLRYRYDSYDYALDHLLVETPHSAARGVDADLAELEGDVLAAERGEFCGAGLTPHAGNPHPEPVIPSRYTHSNPDRNVAGS